MRSIAIGLAAGMLLFWPASPALADEASKNVKIEEMMQLTHADQMIQQIIDQIAAQRAQLGKIDLPSGERQTVDVLQQKAMDRLSKVKPGIMKLYAETYTEEEVASIVEFFKSPAGKAMIEKSPQLIQRCVAMDQQLTGDLRAEIQRATEELKQKYNKK